MLQLNVLYTAKYCYRLWYEFIVVWVMCQKNPKSMSRVNDCFACTTVIKRTSLQHLKYRLSHIGWLLRYRMSYILWKPMHIGIVWTPIKKHVMCPKVAAEGKSRPTAFLREIMLHTTKKQGKVMENREPDPTNPTNPRPTEPVDVSLHLDLYLQCRPSINCWESRRWLDQTCNQQQMYMYMLIFLGGST